MPAAEIKALRLEGKLSMAYDMAMAELQAEPNNIWAKRNLSWVLYSQLGTTVSDLNQFLQNISEVRSLELPIEEEMFYDNLSIVISKAARHIGSQPQVNLNDLHLLFDSIKEFPLVRPSKWFSVLYSGFHKGMKDSYRYLEFADWWDFNNFKPEDYDKDILDNGKEMMAMVEQATIAYSKHLLPVTLPDGSVDFNKEKVQGFMPFLDSVIESHGDYQYPLYFKTKLLLALGDNEQTLNSFIPFARKKRNDFWVWEVLAQIFEEDSDKVLACYCRALTCKASEDFLVKLHQKMASLLITKEMYNEAKTEIDTLVSVRAKNGWGIPGIINSWKNQEWFAAAVSKSNNHAFYRKYIDEANALLYSNVEEEKIFVSYVNTERKMLNFMSEAKHGFFKYEFLIRDVTVGDVLLVRFNGNGSEEGLHKLFTLMKVKDEEFKNIFYKTVSGVVRKRVDKEFGFLDDIYLHQSIISKNSIVNGQPLSIRAVKSFDKKKNAWGWSFHEIIK